MKLTDAKIKELALEEAVRYHIANFDEIENGMELYNESDDGVDFIEDHASVWEPFEEYPAETVVEFIENMAFTLEEFYKRLRDMETGNNETTKSCCGGGCTEGC